MIAAWYSLSSPASRSLGRSVSSLLAESRSGRLLEADFTITAVEGFPGKLAGRSANVLWQAPGQLLVNTKIDDQRITLARDDETIWIDLPDRKFTVIGEETVPRFTGDATSVEHLTLPDFSLPVHPFQAGLLPLLVRVSEGDGDRSTITPSALGRWLLDLPDFVIETRRRGDDPLEFTARTGGRSIALRFDHLEFRASSSLSDPWRPSAEAAARAEHVALSHLVRFAKVAWTQLGAKTPTLPPATGEVREIGTSGRGRLEDRDGVRVLFLAGTPEEMGRQQGELLAAEVRSVVDRILYGVGVGSSFSKGRWFFGEIEEAQKRIEPFISPAHLREMDAIADAAGLHRQEARLANFFPELFHCSGFALHGSATADGRLYHGRILDYIRGAGLEDNAVVIVCRPEGANAWVNLSYAGFTGSVTAMNEKKVAIGEMGGRGEGNWDGKPMAQLVREVMERCDTIDEAVEWMRKGPRTCEYYYVISDGKTGRAVGIKATPDIFETVWSGESHPQLPDPVADTVLLSAGDRYTELVRRVKANFGKFDAGSARDLMTHPVCMKSNIQSVLFAPETLDFWVANADSENVASHTRYTRFNLAELLGLPDKLTKTP